jgi:hypothetical protein
MPLMIARFCSGRAAATVCWFHRQQALQDAPFRSGEIALLKACPPKNSLESTSIRYVNR